MKNEKTIIAVVCSIMLVLSSSGNVFASGKYDVYRRIDKSFTCGNAEVRLINNAYYKMYAHGPCGTTVRSESQNIFNYNPRKTGYKLKGIKRSITCFANGIGFDNVVIAASQKGSVSGNIKFSSDRKKITVNDTSVVEYYADTNIWVLYNYGELFETSFQVVNKNKKILKTVSYETTKWYY